MQIDDIEETLELLNNIRYFFKNIEDVEKKLKEELINKEYAINDARHEREFSKLNVVEIVNLHKTEKAFLEQRRVIKDKLEIIDKLKSYINKFINKGIIGDTDTAIKNIEELKNTQKNRRYTPRVLKGLKCAEGNETKE